MSLSRFATIAAVCLLLTVVVACNKTPVRNDAQVRIDVQKKLSGDSRVTSHNIDVQADDGVVTLSGPASSDDERRVAAGDAASIDGVKTVVNNLVVQQAQAAPAEAPAPLSRPAKTSGKNENRPVLPPAPMDSNNSPAASLPAAPPQQAVAAQAPPPPAPPKKVTVPAGTQVTVRLNDGLDTERNQVGDSFHGTLGSPIVIDDEVVIPLGADVVGRVVDVKSAGRFAGNSALTLELNSLSVNGRTYNIQTNQWSRQGKGEGKNTAVKAGGGAAVGAIIGGLAGGGKGAAIGSVAGAGAGTGAAATKKGEQIKLAPESTLSFLLINTVTVTQQNSNNKNAGRTQLQ